MSVKIVKFHRMSKRGETSKFDQNLRSHEASKARTTSFKFSRSAKLRYGEEFKFSRAIEYRLDQTAHLKSTPKGRAPYAPKSRCNEARCENAPLRHTQRTEKNPPKRGELLKILQQHAKNAVKPSYKDGCCEPKRYVRRAINFINLAEKDLGCEFKISLAMNRAAVRTRYAQQATAAHRVIFENVVFARAANVKILSKLRAVGRRHDGKPKRHVRRDADLARQGGCDEF